MITLLQKLENDQNYKHDFMKASEKRVKLLSEADIRLLMCNMSQKSGAEMYVSIMILKVLCLSYFL